jgi:uncharacterized membrane protein required for colicin V production
VNLLDCVILLVIVLSAVAGWRSGILRAAFSFAGMLVGIAISSAHYQRLAGELAPMVHSLAWAETIWFVMIVLLGIVAAAMIGHHMDANFGVHRWHRLNKSVGCMIGLVRGCIFGVVCVMIATAFFPDSQTLLEARLPKYFLGTTIMVSRITSKELKQRVFDGLRALPSMNYEMQPPQ